jgi:hypothetical protein
MIFLVAPALVEVGSKVSGWATRSRQVRVVITSLSG